MHLILLRVVGVTDAVGEEERDSCGEVVPMAMREAGVAPSGAEMSRLISSLLRRDTEEERKIFWKQSLCETGSKELTKYAVESYQMEGGEMYICRNIYIYLSSAAQEEAGFVCCLHYRIYLLQQFRF